MNSDQSTPPQSWRDAIEHELNTLHDTIGADDTPQSVLKRLIDWHVSVALDPAVSSAAEALVQRGRGQGATEADARRAGHWPWVQAVERLPEWTNDDAVRVLALTAGDDFGGQQVHDVSAADFYVADQDGVDPEGTEVTRACTHWVYRDDVWPRAQKQIAEHGTLAQQEAAVPLTLGHWDDAGDAAHLPQPVKPAQPAPSSPATIELLRQWEKDGELVARVWGTLTEQEQRISELEAQRSTWEKTMETLAWIGAYDVDDMRNKTPDAWRNWANSVIGRARRALAATAPKRPQDMALAATHRTDVSQKSGDGDTSQELGDASQQGVVQVDMNVMIRSGAGTWFDGMRGKVIGVDEYILVAGPTWSGNFCVADIVILAGPGDAQAHRPR